MIETERLRIFPAGREQMEAFIAAEADAELKKAYTEMLEGCLRHPDQWQWYAMWMIELRDGTHIGDLCFKGLGTDGATEIGYGILEEYQGQGYATEAVDAAVNWALQQTGVTRVEAETEADNRLSQRVLEKCNFLPSGMIGEEGPRFFRTACEQKTVMKHCGTQRIETERLVLRRFSIDDAEAMCRNWASDPEVTKYLTWPAHSSVEVSKAVLKDWIPSYARNDYYQWAIVLKERGSDPIGSISAVQLNDDISMVHIGYCLGEAWWHQGIMTEALKAVMAFFFDVVGANRIESRHDPRNPHSGMVMKKSGMRYEGTMRSSDRNNQGICDACWYALLKTDRYKYIDRSIGYGEKVKTG